MSTISPIPWKAELQRALASDMTADTTLRWLGVPTAREFPSPGDARTWTYKEWGTWCNAHGYREGRRTAHAVMFVHPAHPKFLVSVATTPSDRLSVMRSTTDARRNLIMYARMLDRMLRDRLPELSDDQDAARDELSRWSVSEARRTDTSNQADVVPGETFYRVLQEISRDQKCSLATVLTNAVPGVDEDFQRVIDRAKAGTPVNRLYMDLLHEYRRVLDDQEEVEREERRAQRAKGFTTPAKTPRETVVDLLEQIQRSRRQDLDGVMAALGSAMDRARVARDAIEANTPVVPVLDDPEKDSRIAELTRMNEQADMERTAQALEITRLQKALADEQARRTGTHRVTFARLILETVTGTDFSNLASNLKALKDAAQDEIKEAEKEQHALGAAGAQAQGSAS